MGGYTDPFKRLQLTLDHFDLYVNAPKNISGVGNLGSVLGVYKKHPGQLRYMTRAHIQIKIAYAKIPPVEVELKTISTNPGRKNEIQRRLRRIYDTIRPYRNRVYDATIVITEIINHAYSTGRHVVRTLQGIEYPKGTLITYEKTTTRTVTSDIFQEACAFVARVHRRCALMRIIQVAEKDTKSVPRKLYERHVLGIVKEFL